MSMCDAGRVAAVHPRRHVPKSDDRSDIDTLNLSGRPAHDPVPTDALLLIAALMLPHWQNDRS
ncbi:MAG: hypothetical protein ACK4YU_07685, partial [Paracoccus sp. (in: a-proteobacteria)]